MGTQAEWGMGDRVVPSHETVPLFCKVRHIRGEESPRRSFQWREFCCPIHCDVRFHRCLNMNIDKIIAIGKSIDGGTCLAGKIGVDISCSPRYVNGSHPGTNADSFDQVYGGNNGSFQTPFFT